MRPLTLRVLIPAALLLFFGAGVGARLHGFSLAAWHLVIDGSAAPEVLFGKPQAVRFDDWAVHLPLALAQLAHEPAFPLVNDNIGLGQSALVPIELPVRHVATLFRPQLWGFFLGADLGLAWMWWFRALGLFGVWLAVLAVLGRGRLGVAAVASALVVVSPFFQFWSLNPASATIALGAAFLATVALARSRSRLRIAASAAALAYAGGAFLLALYPPFQIVLAWLYVALVVGWLAAEGGSLPLRRHAALRGLGLAAAGLLVLSLGLLYARDAGEALEAMRASAHPGLRVSHGGERAAWDLLNASLGAPLALGSAQWDALGNVCEAASFLWLAPPLLLFVLLRRVLGGARIDPVIASLGVFTAIFAVFATAGLPELVSRASLLYAVPGARVLIGLGIADVIVLVRFWTAPTPPSPAAPRERRLALGVAAAWGLVLAAAAVPLGRAFPQLPLPLLAGAVLGNTALAFALLTARGRRAAVAAALLVGAASTLWFNPLCRAGSSYLAENPVSRAVLEIDRASGGHTTWVAFGRARSAELLRAAGVRCLNGTLTVPQLALWRPLDPERRFTQTYNRYGEAILIAAPERSPVFVLKNPTSFTVRVDPSSPEFRALGATHALYQGPHPDRFERLSGFEKLGTFGRVSLYRVEPPGASQAEPQRTGG
jgi:hypothetical protein